MDHDFTVCHEEMDRKIQLFEIISRQACDITMVAAMTNAAWNELSKPTTKSTKKRSTE